MTTEWPTPKNAISGRTIYPSEFKELQSKFPKTMLKYVHMEDVCLGQTKNSESKNYLRWFWTWGSAFLGFHGAIKKEALDKNWKMKKIKPFPNEKIEKHQFGIGRVSMAQLMLEAEEAEQQQQEEIDATPSRPVKRKLDFDEDFEDNASQDEKPLPPPTKRPRGNKEEAIDKSEVFPSGF